MNPSFSEVTNKRYNPYYHAQHLTYQTIIPNRLRSEVATYTTIKINL
jgi:hypothetical protein